MQKYLSYVQDTMGNALANASVQVYVANGSVATIYSDNGITVKVNPIVTSTDGSYWFYAANGRYDVVITKSGYTFAPTETAAQQLYDPADATGGSNVLTLTSPDGTPHTLTVGNDHVLGVNY